MWNEFMKVLQVYLRPNVGLLIKIKNRNFNKLLILQMQATNNSAVKKSVNFAEEPESQATRINR